MAITSFSGKHRFLSNFFTQRDGTHVEGQYQAAKTEDIETQRLFVGLTPWDAKRLGRRVKLRADWEEVKDSIMEALLRAKFSDPQLKAWLVATGNEELIEGNTWGDTYWGVCNGVGENKLGKLLMKIRSEL